LFKPKVIDKLPLALRMREEGGMMRFVDGRSLALLPDRTLAHGWVGGPSAAGTGFHLREAFGKARSVDAMTETRD
jgi:hypothetical protein